MNRISEALSTYDHYFEDVHNKLVVGGADKILVERLDEAVANSKQHEAIDPICRLLLMIYRCGDHQFQESVAIVGGDLFPPLLATVFLQEERDTYNSVFLLMKRLIRNKLDLRDVPWSFSLLDLFQEIIDVVDPCTREEPLSFVMTWLVEGILLQRENNKLFLMGHPCLFNSIVIKFANTFRPGCATNLLVVKFMLILATATINRLEMVKNVDYLRLLFLLCHDDCTETQEMVLEILAITASDREVTTRIFNFLDHKFVDIAIKALDDVCLSKNAINFVKVLVTNVSGNSILSKRPNLLQELTKQAVKAKEHSHEAAQIVTQLAQSLSVNNGRGDLLDAILQLCKAIDCRIRRQGTKVMLAQAQSRPACSFFIVHVPEVTGVIAEMLLDDDSEVRGTAAEIIACLASSSLNVNALVRNKPLLDALAENATTTDEPTNEKAQQHAVIAILHLVVHHRSIKAVAKQHKIAQSLSEFGLSGDREQILKQAAIRGVACLSLYM